MFSTATHSWQKKRPVSPQVSLIGQAAGLLLLKPEARVNIFSSRLSKERGSRRAALGPSARAQESLQDKHSGD